MVTWSPLLRSCGNGVRWRSRPCQTSDTAVQEHGQSNHFTGAIRNRLHVHIVLQLTVERLEMARSFQISLWIHVAIHEATANAFCVQLFLFHKYNQCILLLLPGPALRVGVKLLRWWTYSRNRVFFAVCILYISACASCIFVYMFFEHALLFEVMCCVMGEGDFVEVVEFIQSFSQQ